MPNWSSIFCSWIVLLLMTKKSHSIALLRKNNLLLQLLAIPILIMSINQIIQHSSIPKQLLQLHNHFRHSHLINLTIYTFSNNLRTKLNFLSQRMENHIKDKILMVVLLFSTKISQHLNKAQDKEEIIFINQFHLMLTKQTTSKTLTNQTNTTKDHLQKEILMEKDHTKYSMQMTMTFPLYSENQ